MIPALVRRIAISTGVVGLVAVPCIMIYDRGAAVAFGITTLWMIANLFVWTIIMKTALKPKTESRDGVAVVLALAAKLILLGGGIAALVICAPYTAGQVWGIMAGVGSISIISGLKALGAWLTNRHLDSSTIQKKSEAGT